MPLVWNQIEKGHNLKMPKLFKNAKIEIPVPVLHAAYNAEKNDTLNAKIEQQIRKLLLFLIWPSHTGTEYRNKVCRLPKSVTHVKWQDFYWKMI